MTSLLDIRASDIAQLSDTDLRTLVSMLCEADLALAGQPTTGVTAGGDQNASDGGIDVRVQAAAIPAGGYIPRAATGFQVKASEFSAGDIRKEMRPNGVLRPVLVDLAKRAGAYVIASGASSVSDSALRARIKAMRDAVSDCPAGPNLELVFYDGDRIARWVRLHPGLQAWVRERIGQPISGWQGYAAWSAPHAAQEDYLVDPAVRIRDARATSESSMSTENGIRRIRDALRRPGGVARLIGLSGLGKTRLVQALFDAKVGADPLPADLVVYTDLGHAPLPSPRDLVTHYARTRQRAIVVVDNCPPDTHRALASAAATQGSQVSLLTIEFDVGEDDPEGTDVFVLAAASSDVIAEIIKRRQPQVSQVDRGHIAELSGGNARVALALARTVQAGDNVSKLSDKDLFDRLFLQRKGASDELSRVAAVCALVYSFDVETSDGNDAELPHIAKLAGITPAKFYHQVSDLMARDLVQRRGRWRALLPHALANRLARSAISGIASGTLLGSIKGWPQRLQQSFSRRLGYLHDNPSAQAILHGWLAPSGPLADLGYLDESGWALLRNAAPVDPGAVMTALEKALASEGAEQLVAISNGQRRNITALLHSIAYDADQFQRCALLMARFAAAEPPNYNEDAARDRFGHLFHAFLSGTHATPSQRVAVIDLLLGDKNEALQNLGLDALDEMLEATHFSSSYAFEFGSRTRDYGWQPEGRAAQVEWYELAIRRCVDLAVSGDRLGEQARAILGGHFRSLWSHAGMITQLEKAVDQLGPGGWHEGWIGVRSTIGFDASKMPPVLRKKLKAIAKRLKPSDLAARIRTYVLSHSHMLDVADDADDSEPMKGYERAEKEAEVLGRLATRDWSAVSPLLPELLSGQVPRGWSFGRGLTEESSASATWKSLKEAAAKIEAKQLNVQVLRGMLNALSATAPKVACSFLDEAVNDPVLGPFFPSLQAAALMDAAAVARLEASVKLGVAPAWQFSNLSFGRVTDRISGEALSQLVLAIAGLPNGFYAATQILSMRFYSAKDSGEEVPNPLRECGRQLLDRYDFNHDRSKSDNDIGRLVKICYAGEEQTTRAAAFCKRMVEAASKHYISPYTHRDLISKLFHVQPLAALNSLVGTGTYRLQLARESFHESGHAHPMDCISLEELVRWVKEDAARFPALAAAGRMYGPNDAGELEWTPLALKLIELAPDVGPVLGRLRRALYPSSWSGSLAAILDKYRSLVARLLDHPRPEVVDWARQTDAALAAQAEDERLRESRGDERFE